MRVNSGVPVVNAMPMYRAAFLSRCCAGVWPVCGPLRLRRILTPPLTYAFEEPKLPDMLSIRFPYITFAIIALLFLVLYNYFFALVSEAAFAADKMHDLILGFIHLLTAVCRLRNVVIQ